MITCQILMVTAVGNVEFAPEIVGKDPALGCTGMPGIVSKCFWLIKGDLPEALQITLVQEPVPDGLAILIMLVNVVEYDRECTGWTSNIPFFVR